MFHNNLINAIKRKVNIYISFGYNLRKIYIFKYEIFFQYVQFEKDGVTDVGIKYNGLSKSVDSKPGTWKAEDNLETA